MYLSRQVARRHWQVEVWDTAERGERLDLARSISRRTRSKNVRPVSPRGMPNAFDGDLRVIWMRGAYPSYETYETSITATWGGDNQAPVADAEPAVRSGPAPLPVTFDVDRPTTRTAPITDWQWDFGDGTTGTGPRRPTSTRTPGRYFPTLTVTDNGGGDRAPFVEEIVVGAARRPGHPHRRHGRDHRPRRGRPGEPGDGVVLRVRADDRVRAAHGAAGTLRGGDSLQQVSAALPGLVAGRLYHYRLVATNATGTTEGEDRVMVGRQPRPARTPIATPCSPRPASPPTGASASCPGELGSGDEAGGGPGRNLRGRFVLGQPGVLGRARRHRGRLRRR